MNETRYSSWYNRLSGRYRDPATADALGRLDRALVYAFAAAYVALLAFLAVTGDARLPRAFVVPALEFAAVTVARAALDRPRPYEAEPIVALIPKDTRGKSMPSRHMASAVIIACTYLWVVLPLGCVLLAGCAAIAFTRIVGGVHYPRDIAVAAIVGALFALVGYAIV